MAGAVPWAVGDNYTMLKRREVLKFALSTAAFGLIGASRGNAASLPTTEAAKASLPVIDSTPFAAPLIEPAQLWTNKAFRVVIDTRSPEAYAIRHIPDAVNIRDITSYFAMSSPEGLNNLQQLFAGLFGAAGLSGKAHAIIYEDAMNGGLGQSCRGYYLLKYLGYEKVSVLHGGLQAWTSAGLPTVSGSVARAPIAATFPLQVNNALMVSKAELRTTLDNPKIIKLDVRDAAEWNGMQTTPTSHDPALRRGRIPGSTWIDWQAFLDLGSETVRFLPANKIRSLCARQGVTPESSIYVYCYKGSRASSTFVALQRAGFTNVRVYLGSWNEWGRDLDMPIEIA